MLEIIKNSVLAGIGLALKSKQEIEDLGKDLAEKGKMGQEQAKQFLDDLMLKYDEARDKLDDKIETSVKRILEKADLPSRSDVMALNKQLEEIKALLSEKDNKA